MIFGAMILWMLSSTTTVAVAEPQYGPGVYDWVAGVVVLAALLAGTFALCVFLCTLMPRYLTFKENRALAGGRPQPFTDTDPMNAPRRRR